MMIKKINKNYILLIFSFLAILPYCCLSLFSNPSADDFGFAVQAQENDMFHLIKQTYLYWNGRYVSNIFIYLNPITHGSFLGYKIIPILIILLFYVVTYHFIKTILTYLANTEQLIISLTLCLLFTHNMPTIAEGVYWFTGAVIYTLGVIFWLVYASYLVKVIRNPNKKFSVAFLTMLLFIVCGFNEVLTLLMLLMLGGLTFIFRKTNLKGRNIIATQFLLSLLFAAIMIFSPGNSFREEAYANAHNFSHSLLYSALQTIRFSFTWVTSVPLLVASLLYLPIHKKLKKESTIFRSSFYLNKWVSLIVLFVIIFVCVFPAYWATGILGQHRTLNVAYFFFLIMWFINLTVWFNEYQERLNVKFTPKMNLIFGIVLFIGLVFTGNGYHALFDLYSGSAMRYNSQLQNRFRKLSTYHQDINHTIIVAPLKEKPKSLYVSDISEDHNFWTNRAYNLYFELDEAEIIIGVKDQY